VFAGDERKSRRWLGVIDPLIFTGGEIGAFGAELRQEITLARLREELTVSQKQLAAALGLSQPAVVKLEKVENDPIVSTFKRYVAASGAVSLR